MRVDFSSGRSPRAGSSALAAEQERGNAERETLASSLISAGSSARAAGRAVTRGCNSGDDEWVVDQSRVQARAYLQAEAERKQGRVFTARRCGGGAQRGSNSCPDVTACQHGKQGGKQRKKQSHRRCSCIRIKEQIERWFVLPVRVSLTPFFETKGARRRSRLNRPVHVLVICTLPGRALWRIRIAQQ